MGIHYDYKSTRGAKKMQKQQEREQRRRGKKKKAEAKKQKEYTVPEDVVLTLDMITDPNKCLTRDYLNTTASTHARTSRYPRDVRGPTTRC